MVPFKRKVIQNHKTAQYPLDLAALLNVYLFMWTGQTYSNVNARRQNSFTAEEIIQLLHFKQHVLVPFLRVWKSQITRVQAR